MEYKDLPDPLKKQFEDATEIVVADTYDRGYGKGYKEGFREGKSEGREEMHTEFYGGWE